MQQNKVFTAKTLHAACMAALAALVLTGAGCPANEGGHGSNGGENPPHAQAGAPWKLTLSGKPVTMRYVPNGSFQRDTAQANISEITRGYWLAETETTQELFQAVMGANPSYFNGTAGGEQATPDGDVQGKRPVETVDWYAAILFCNRLSIQNGKDPVYSVTVNEREVDWERFDFAEILYIDTAAWDAALMDITKNGYRLPTDMEWLWAAMGADKSSQPNITGYAKPFAGSNGTNDIADYAWYSTSSDGTVITRQTGKKQPNELGLQDMSGNVWEYCWDWFDGSESENRPLNVNGPLSDYTGVPAGINRVIRGGGYSYPDIFCKLVNRSDSSRVGRNNRAGFRFACTAD